jgi:signal peptidase I
MRALRLFLLLAAAALVLLPCGATGLWLFLPAFHLGRFVVAPNQGMAPTIRRGDGLYLNELAFLIAPPRRGDIVCFPDANLPPLLPRGRMQMKRVVGLPGETISIRDGRLFVGDRPAPELARFRYETLDFDNYLTNEKPAFTVPPGTCFVLGDYPDGSFDSRFFGPVPLSEIAGRAIFKYWPPRDAGFLR